MNRRLARISLLWKIMLSTSVAITLVFAVAGWIAVNSATRATTDSINHEVQASFEAYQSLWKARADRLSSVSSILSAMSDVREFDCVDCGDHIVSFGSDFTLPKKGKYGVMAKFKLKDGKVRSVKFWYTVK